MAAGAAYSDVASAGEIRCHEVPKCLLCGAKGGMLYEGQRDRLFGAPGVWNFRQCPNYSCGLIWIDPMPVEEDIGRAYGAYYTHQANTPATSFKKTCLRIWRKGAVPFLSIVSPLHRERRKLELMYLHDRAPGRVLDVGCGSGERLAKLRDRGWEVFGQDVDPRAVAQARQAFQIDVRVGSLDKVGFAPNSFDCVIMNHVIEHVHDPVRLLKQCKSLLKKGGDLIVVTPNCKSVAHRHFGTDWRGLEPPRHLFIFSRSALASVAKRSGLSVVRSWTTAANAFTVTFYSVQLRRDGLSFTAGHKILRIIYAVAFQYYASMLNAFSRNQGEEIVLHLKN
jgi:2-polyprenyl-3-methyl-5-hydroxy-6-metoxy-1,4-benzoquinol methylase